jgi:hypothetical protein
MTDAALQEAHEAFGRQILGQVARVTGELNRLDELLKAGRVDARLLSQFRQAVDQVRTSGWQVQVWLKGDTKALAAMLLEERVRTATRLAQQLTSEIAASSQEIAGRVALKERIQSLAQVL